MDGIRAVLAVISFCVGIYFIYDLIANGFDWTLLLATLISFILSHFFWPKNYRDNGCWDWLGDLVDLPFQLIFGGLRAMARMFRGSDGGGADVDF